MIGSKNKFFFQPTNILLKNKTKLIYLLRDIWQRDEKIIQIYLDAYKYFMDNPSDYDGATIVKDLKAIPGLDIWAMLHDYLYIVYNTPCNVNYKYYSDIIYIWEMERMGVSAYASWSRFLGLSVFGTLFFTPYVLLKGKRMDKNMKKEMKNIYNIFCKLHNK